MSRYYILAVLQLHDERENIIMRNIYPTQELVALISAILIEQANKIEVMHSVVKVGTKMWKAYQ